MQDKEKSKEQLIEELADLRRQMSEFLELKNTYEKSENALKKAREELDIQLWGTQKTNEAVKFLYKELEKKNKELQELDKLKSDFLNTTSHELRTPLTGIKESVAQVLDGLHGQINSEQKQYLSLSLEEIDRLKRIVDNLLDASKLEAKRFKIFTEKVDIVSLARRVILTFETQAKGKNLTLRENIAVKEATAYVDKDSIIIVFTNLIGNAIKFTDTGQIEISVADKDDCVECSVADTGRGISEEDLPRVFGKFQQFGRTEGPGQKGTGLGLNICKGIIELNRGKIRVESALDKGTRFIFTLPKYNAEVLYKTYIGEVIKKAVQEKVALSILTFGINGFASTCKMLGSQKINALLEDTEALAKQNLRQADAVIKYAHTLFVALLEIDKKQALEIANRLQKTIGDYLSKENMRESVTFFSKVVNYPEDCMTAKEMYEALKAVMAYSNSEIDN